MPHRRKGKYPLLVQDMGKFGDETSGGGIKTPAGMISDWGLLGVIWLAGL